MPPDRPLHVTLRVGSQCQQSWTPHSTSAVPSTHKHTHRYIHAHVQTHINVHIHTYARTHRFLKVQPLIHSVYANYFTLLHDLFFSCHNCYLTSVCQLVCAADQLICGNREHRSLKCSVLQQGVLVHHKNE